jgi:hypothetical protein
MRGNKIENIEFLESTQGIKENEYKDQVLDLLDMYADFRKKDKNNSIIKVIDDNCYRLRLAYFGRFI